MLIRRDATFAWQALLVAFAGWPCQKVDATIALPNLQDAANAAAGEAEFHRLSIDNVPMDALRSRL
jgi:hypothetical protein